MGTWVIFLIMKLSSIKTVDPIQHQVYRITFHHKSVNIIYADQTYGYERARISAG